MKSEAWRQLKSVVMSAWVGGIEIAETPGQSLENSTNACSKYRMVYWESGRVN